MKQKMKERYLFEFYGELLTEKQRQILEYYYNDDYSLAEIAEVLSVSRQGIFDVIKRTRLMMETYEDKLGLMSKFLNNRKVIKDVQDDLLDLAFKLADQEIKKRVLAIVDQLNGVNEGN